MGVFPCNLRSHQNFCEPAAGNPLLCCLDQFPADPAAPVTIRNNEAADFAIRRRLQMMDDSDIDPAYDPAAAQTGGIDGMILQNRKAPDPCFHDIRRDRISKLRTQLRGGAGIRGLDFTNGNFLGGSVSVHSSNFTAWQNSTAPRQNTGSATMRTVAAIAAQFDFQGELNDFLSPERRYVEFEHLAGPTDTIKHVIESLGVPHTEVARIAVNGVPGSLSEPLAAGDRVTVFPYVPPVALKHWRFVVDGHLGRLAAYLRMLGFDTCYDRYADDPWLAATASKECRCLLTRDVGLLKRREIEEGYCVRADKPHDQLREVSHRFALRSQFTPFSRCMDCNGPVCSVSKEEVADLLPPHTRETKDAFSRCQNCGKVFWRGTHYDRMAGWIQDLLESGPG